MLRAGCLVLLTALSVLPLQTRPEAVGGPGEGQAPQGTSGRRTTTASPTVSMVSSEPSFFYGQRVVFGQARVAEFINPYLFKIRDREGPEDPDLLVLTPAPTKLPPEGTLIVVEGMVRQFLPSQFTLEFPWFAEATKGADMDDLQEEPVVVARRVELPAGTSLILK